MNGELLQRHFERIGASIEIELTPRRNVFGSRDPIDFTLDVREDHQEVFVLSVRRDVVEQYEFIPLHVEPALRHLVLLAKTELPKVGAPKQKFLCGHDERHWFVANVPNQLTTVRTAFEALQPELARTALEKMRVRGARRYRRHNGGYVRQGEWFFVPQPTFQLNHNEVIHKHEPIRRSGGKPHFVENIVRRGGIPVYVCSRHPNGLTEEEHKKLIAEEPTAWGWRWTVMVRDAQVYARGYVRHPDHKTIQLRGWHRVLMSNEARTEAVAFLD